MGNYFYNRVDILLVDPDLNSRQSVRMVLNNSGFRELRVGSLMEELQEHVVQVMPDLLICESELPDGDFCRFVRSLRHHEIGNNPFLPVIALTWNPTPQLVRNVIGSGADDLLSKPISTGQLLDRINTLVIARKPFVVTSEYIGPDRRSKSEREKDQSIPKMEVPNTLKIKATGKGNIGDVQRAIDTAIGEVNVFKIERHGDQIGYLIDKIAPDLENGIFTSDTDGFLRQLVFVAEDTGRRLAGTKYEHVSELCGSLIKVTDTICASVAVGKPSAKDVRLLRPLSQAIRIGFENEDHAALAARKISAEIGGG